MSVVVQMLQNTKQPKKIGLKFLSSWSAFQNLHYGIPDQAYVLDTYNGEEDIRGQLFILFDQKKYGRGMSFTVDENYHAELVLNSPATETDIEMFYKFIHDFSKNFRSETFIQEGDTYNIEQIPQLKEQAIAFNRNLIKTYLKANLTIFGCIYPIVIEEAFIDKLKALEDGEAYRCYEDYLDQKQKQDCYFTKPLLYKNADEHTIHAKYALTEDVPSVFPIEPYLPYGYNQSLKAEITDWSVVLLQKRNDGHQVYKEVLYVDFCSVICLETYPKFDAKHVIVTFNKEILAKIEKQKTADEKTTLNFLKRIWKKDAKK